MGRDPTSRLIRLAACILLGVLRLNTAAQAQSSAANDATVYAVAYVDVLPAAHEAATTALKQYRDASSKEAGYVRIDLLEQIGRAHHFVVLEAWRDQQSWELHGAFASTMRMQNALQAIRLGSYDQRVYKALSIGAATQEKTPVVVVTHVDIGGMQRNAPELLMQLAEESRKDEGNLRFDVFQQSARGNHFTIVETWRSQASLEAHAAALHTRQSREQLQPLTGSPLDERLYKTLD